MKLFPVVLALAASAAAADKCAKFANGIPSCAIPALIKCDQKAGCDPTDYKCGCDNQAKISKCATPKIEKACSKKDQKKTLAATTKLCNCEES